MRARGRLLSCLVTVVIALAGFVTAGVLPAAAGPSGTLQYVALGDSYAAGIGAPPYVSSGGCLQSNQGYPELLDSEKHIRLHVNATCPGATTSTVADKQLSELTPGVELVTLTVGGNDLGFADLAGACLAGTPEQCKAAFDTANHKLLALGPDLKTLYAAVADAAPKALIVVTGYPHLVERTAPFPLDLIDALNDATDALNSTIEDAVSAADPTGDHIRYVDVIDAFAGHGIGCTPSPNCLFINPPTMPLKPEAFHPTAAGYVAYADAISAVVQAWLTEQAQLV
jgi:lysophospholipase L1-like esterase